MLTQDQIADYRRSYEEQGFALLRGFFKPEDFKPYQKAYMRLVQEKTGLTFFGMHDPALRDLYDQDQPTESEVYVAVRDLPEMRAMAADVRVAQALNEIVHGHDWKLFEKMIMRIDMPNWTKEIAHWHQDFFYVKGNTDVVTIWMPLQDVFHENGCLQVAPGTHKLGIVDHTHIVGKRNTPDLALLEKVQQVEMPMKFGDILLFNALLFHAGQLNSSDHIRYSFQFRYTPASLPTDAGMGKLLDLPKVAVS
jgi:phytanoyl-CoA hydroxylase